MILAHGLFGFSELHMPGGRGSDSDHVGAAVATKAASLSSPSSWVPAIQYWHGIQAALREHGGVDVIAASVPPAATIQKRARKLREDVDRAVERWNILSGRSGSDGARSEVKVNIVAHSMGGLDARCMITEMAREREAAEGKERTEGTRCTRTPRTPRWSVASLTTVATPHRGSAVADYVLERVLGTTALSGREGMADGYGKSGSQGRTADRLRALLRRATTIGGDDVVEAVEHLTRSYMENEFNPSTPDDPAVRYFSYGAAIDGRPRLLSPFRRSHALLERLEGANDGLVSVRSARWGEYKGTLVGVSHLDLINWSNKLGWTVRRWLGQEQS